MLIWIVFDQLPPAHCFSWQLPHPPPSFRGEFYPILLVSLQRGESEVRHTNQKECIFIFYLEFNQSIRDDDHEIKWVFFYFFIRKTHAISTFTGNTKNRKFAIHLGWSIPQIHPLSLLSFLYFKICLAIFWVAREKRKKGRGCPGRGCTGGIQSGGWEPPHSD